MDQQVRRLLEMARSVIRDLAYGYRPEACAERPESVVARITELLHDGYDVRSSTVADER
jgi:hypothetical protein